MAMTPGAFLAASSPTASGQVAAAFRLAGLAAPAELGATITPILAAPSIAAKILVAPVEPAATPSLAAEVPAALHDIEALCDVPPDVPEATVPIQGISGTVNGNKAYALYSKSLIDAAVKEIVPLQQKVVEQVRLSKTIKLGVTILTAALSSGVIASLQQNSQSVAVACSLGALVASLAAILADYLAADPAELGEVSAKIETAKFLSGKLDLYLNNQIPMIDIGGAFDQAREFVEYLQKMIIKYKIRN